MKFPRVTSEEVNGGSATISENCNSLKKGAANCSEYIAPVQTDEFRQLRDLVTTLGGDPVDLLRKSQIDPHVLDDGSGAIPCRLLVRLLERASVELGCPDFGMRLAAVQAAQGGTSILRHLDVAMGRSSTLGEALRDCADRVHTYSPATQICFHKLPDDPRVFLLFEILLGGLTQQRQAVEYALMLTQHTILAVSKGKTRAREIWFTHEPFAPRSTYRANFNANLRFAQSMNGLFIHDEDFDQPVTDADSPQYEMRTSFIDHPFPAAAMTLSARVRISVARLLMEGNCTYPRVASALGLHPRTLQRKLRKESESFESIRDGVRRDVALRYLQQSNVPLVRVTEILGYSETSVLSRSCNRWFSASPQKLRKRPPFG